METDTSRWGPLTLVDQITEGSRNEVWRGSLGGRVVSIRRSRRPSASLDWELDLIDHLGHLGFRVPSIIPTLDGRRHLDGVVVQHWLDGRPPDSERDWHLVAITLRKLHAATTGHAQRPSCLGVSELLRTSVSLDADLASLPDDVAELVLSIFATVAHLPLSVIHGDPMASNVRIDHEGAVGLLDFDESRVDVAWHDLSNLGVQVLEDDEHAHALRLSDAWEAANGWVIEPEYARRRLESLEERREK